jgi:hypothetical protein
MYSAWLRAGLVMLTASLAWAVPAYAQSQPPAAAASQAQFPQIPLRRDAPADGAMAETIGWAALLLIAAAGAGLVVLRRGALPRGAQGPKVIGRTALTQQASLHVVEWQGEELLLGCTTQSVVVLTRRPAEPAKEKQ